MLFSVSAGEGLWAITLYILPLEPIVPLNTTMEEPLESFIFHCKDASDGGITRFSKRVNEQLYVQRRDLSPFNDRPKPIEKASCQQRTATSSQPLPAASRYQQPAITSSQP